MLFDITVGYPIWVGLCLQEEVTHLQRYSQHRTSDNHLHVSPSGGSCERRETIPAAAVCVDSVREKQFHNLCPALEDGVVKGSPPSER